MDPEAKAEKMKRKTEDMRRMFNLPDTESVIQDYACALRRSMLVPGRMFISQNYACFYASLPETFESIPFRKITDIVRDKTALLFDNAINLITPSATYYYGSFVHRDETFNLLTHLWKNPPSYYDVEEITLSQRPMSYAGSTGNNGNNGNNGYNGNGGSGNFNGNPSGNSANPFDSADGSSSGRKSAPAYNGNSYNGGSDSGYGQQQQSQVKVDTATSRNALRIAMETREIGGATMNELSYQAEVIDLIERDVENIHNNLDKANRLVRGIESVGGSVANAFSGDKHSGRDVHFKDRTLVSSRIEMPVDISILWKLSNDDLVPAIIRFTGDKVSIIQQGPKKTEKDQHYAYESMESLWVRARPLHVDVRFRDKKINRFRFMSSYVQSVVNEFCLRAKPKIGEVSVIFEPGTRKFSYGNASIPLPSESTGQGERKGNMFRRDNGPAALPGVFKTASDDVKKGVLQQEEDLASISDVLGDLHGMALTMGGEIVRQTEQLDRVTVRVDLANDRLQHTNQRINNML